MKTENIFANIPDIIPEELFESLLSGKNLKIERIVSEGHVTPDTQWYDQPWYEWVLVVKGQALLAYEDGSKLAMQEGDYVLIPAHTRHRVEWTPPDSKTIWLAIHFPGA